MKPIYKSRTFWFNVLALAATIVGYLPPKYAATAIPIVNVALRFITSESVTLFGE